ncbi:MAG: carboxypeptidase-like regulatory domain-containing protein [Bacteroidota bacterium]|nr:carboxypeptidase-like regulatory domain-containing protein [Bacteroidota bacterium]
MQALFLSKNTSRFILVISTISLLIINMLSSNFLFAQTDGYIQGTIRNANHKPVPAVSVSLDGVGLLATTNDSGYFKLRLSARQSVTITLSCVGYQSVKKQLRLNPGETVLMNETLIFDVKSIREVTVIGESDRLANPNNVEVKNFNQLPNTNGSFESLIKTLPGVSSSNELSSQYSVRGGNFDENLVYVNDVEIIRPFLIRSGQQEGLSFINPDMVSSVRFSAGGFESRYGDKMSSVLDVSYRKPSAAQYIVTAGLLGGGITAEGASKNGKFTHITGVRYKTSRYLLNTLETNGEYQPSFTDIQTLLTWQASKKMEFSFLGNYAQNDYRFVPESRSTTFGTISQMYNLKIYYDGQERDKYRSALGAFTVNYRPVESLALKLVTSGYSAYEQETFDIEGQYLINELDNTAGSTTYGDSLLNLGVGGMLNHARNYLWVNTWSAAHIGIFNKNRNTLRWSLEYKQEHIKDRLSEWTLIDSAGYSQPYSPSVINLQDVASTANRVNSFRVSGYVQDTWQFSGGETRYALNSGVRFNYWNYNTQLLVSPRVRFSMKPPWKRDIIFRLAAGVYYQPPFYKEMRDFHGVLNPDIKAQKSLHFVMGSDYTLKIWDRPFILTSEVYYKYMDNLIPYKVDNLRIRYTAKNNASGYAKGIDMKLNGEFVPGVESWASLSLMQTEENQKDDYYIDSNGNRVEPGYYPRPTDQLVNFNLFFQDYLPNNPTLQMHLNLSYGNPLHVSSPLSNRFDKTFPLGPYRRVDMGLSKIIKDKNTTSALPLFNKFKELIVSLEVFNLLDINNKASYLWIQSVSNQENIPNVFAVPNYLTSRRLNIKIVARF